MFQVNSYTISEEQKSQGVNSIEHKFQIDNGNTGAIIISDPLLDNFAVAQERAKSEFLKQSYAIGETRFSTYRTDLILNQVIMVKGVNYLIKSLSTITSKTAIKTNVRAVRYE